MTRLSVNINKIALLRNSRGGGLPDLRQFALDCESYGAEGITVHPRPDQRHIRYDDLYMLKEVLSTEFNIEGFPSAEFMDIICEVRPHQCTLVPDLPGALTSTTGWDTINQGDFLIDVVAQLQEAGIRTSLFLNADLSMLEGVGRIGTDRIELYTGLYAKQYEQEDQNKAVRDHILTSRRAAEMGVEINAGHDLNLHNLTFYKESIQNLKEVSIGHALISDSLYYGVQNTIGMYKKCLR